MCLFNHVMSRVATRIFSTDCYPLYDWNHRQYSNTVSYIYHSVLFTIHAHTGCFCCCCSCCFFRWLLSNDSMESLSVKARVAFYRPIENFEYILKSKACALTTSHSLSFSIQMYAHIHAQSVIIHVKNGPKTNRFDKLTKQIAEDEMVATAIAKYHFIPKSWQRCEHFASITHTNTCCMRTKNIDFFAIVNWSMRKYRFLFDSNSNNRQKQHTALTYTLI